MYKYRHLIKNTFDIIKQYRSISKRYDKLESNYACMLLLAFILMWLPMYY
ncbi:MAG: transposase [Gilliamella sp.]|nr:transposase [Gilliamella sp.]MCO6556493.1 transposase [Gilliamella sp.]